MANDKIILLEQKIEELIKADESLYTHLQNVQAEVDAIMKKIRNSSDQPVQSDDRKVSYLAEVNEEMFQQNFRLRQLIERCVEEKLIPTQDEYYKALKGES
jgi:FtsZ-binding cell division protein ZapB